MIKLAYDKGGYKGALHINESYYLFSFYLWDREIFLHWLITQMPSVAGAMSGQAEGKNLDLNSGLPHKKQEPSSVASQGIP